MRREPKQETVREKAHPANEHYMRGHRDGKAGRPANPGDPERKRGDGMKMAEGSRKDAGTEKGRPAKPADPEKKKGDGVKTAMRGEHRGASVVPPMGGARMAVR